MNTLQRRALEYVRNTGGNATREIFIEDHEPIGGKLWTELVSAGWIKVEPNGTLSVTELGEAALGT